MTSCSEKFGNTVEGFIGRSFSKLGLKVGTHPRKVIAFAVILTVVCGAGFVRWTTENRQEKLWVPQNTIAERETELYENYFGSVNRFNSVIVRSSQAESGDSNVLTKERLMDAMMMHNQIETKQTTVDGETYDFLSLCAAGGGSCFSSFDGICNCLVQGILKQWNYDIDTLKNDEDIMATLNMYGNKDDLEAVLGKPLFNDDDELVSAEAFTISYLIKDRSKEAGSDEIGSEADPISEEWELNAFLNATQSVPTDFPSISVDYFAGRSFSDEFGGAITGDLLFVQVSYVVVFIFLGANLGKIKCGSDSRWTMSLAALFMVGLSTGACFAISSAVGLFYGPVHSLLPFILLGIGVDNAFVIVNAFNRERKVKRTSESNEDLAKRSANALARAGASITVTSATDLVAFAISASSSLPALASFCGYAAIGLFFLWLFASTFFTAALVLDERRQRDNRRECFCCIKRKRPNDTKDDGFTEDMVSTYFRKYHAPTILSIPGKVVVLLIFSTLLGLGIWGSLNLSVEDTSRSFIPKNSYLNDYISSSDIYFPSGGTSLLFTFEGSSDIYSKRNNLADLDSRLTGLSTASPYIAEPISENTYRNVMTGLSNYLKESGSDAIGGVTLGDDSWPTTEADFVKTLSSYTSFTGPGAVYGRDVFFSEDGTEVEAIRVKCNYITLTKIVADEVVDDSDKQIQAMDDTRAMVESWGDDVPSSFTFCEKFITIEGFKLIRRELFINVGLAFLAVGVIVFLTIASPVTSLLVTLNVGFCIIEILGFMFFLNIAIDSVSVINIVLAVGLSIDYSAHVGHCFMQKGGNDKSKRALEALADIGAAVLNGAVTTFLAVVVLLFSTSYVFQTLSLQFALTVAFGVSHGLILLPVLLSLLGPKPFSSLELPEEGNGANKSEEA